MLQFVSAPFRTSHHDHDAPTLQQDCTSYTCARCHAQVPLSASHCSQCGHNRPKSAMVDRSQLLDLLFYFFRHEFKQQEVEVELETLCRLQGQLMASPHRDQNHAITRQMTNDHPLASQVNSALDNSDQSDDNEEPRYATLTENGIVNHKIHLVARPTSVNQRTISASAAEGGDSPCKGELHRKLLATNVALASVVDGTDNSQRANSLSSRASFGGNANEIDEGEALPAAEAAANATTYRYSHSTTEHFSVAQQHCIFSNNVKIDSESEQEATGNVADGANRQLELAPLQTHVSTTATEQFNQFINVQNDGEPELVTPTKLAAEHVVNNDFQFASRAENASVANSCISNSFFQGLDIPNEASTDGGIEPYPTETAHLHETPQPEPSSTAGVAFIPSYAMEAEMCESSDSQAYNNDNDNAERMFRRLRKLQNHLQPGIHDHSALYWEKAPTDATRTTRSHYKWEKQEICRRSWSDPSVLSAENPVHFPRGGLIEPRLVGVANQLRMDFVKLCSDKSVEMTHISTALEIKPCYMKGHLEEPFLSNVFAFTIPPCLLIKRRADQKAIAFITTNEPSVCDTHYDRDTSLLLMLAGKKEVYLAPPRQRWQDEVIQNNSTIFESLDPFLDFNRGSLGSEWKLVVMQQGDALLIPRKWLHAVRSHPGTVAVSFQVEIASVPFDVSSYFDIPSLEELMAASLETTEQLQSDSIPHSEGCLDRDSDEFKNILPPETPSETVELSAAGIDTDAASPVEALNTPEQTASDSQPESKKNQKKRKAISSTPVDTPLPLAAKRRLALLQHPELAAARKNSRSRGGRRTRFECDWCDCAGFSKDGEMWFLRLFDEKDMDEKVLPMVLDSPVKFLCLSCVPRRGASVVSPDVILEYPEELAVVEKYNFYLGTKVDYQVWSGKYQKEQFL